MRKGPFNVGPMYCSAVFVPNALMQAYLESKSDINGLFSYYHLFQRVPFSQQIMYIQQWHNIMYMYVLWFTIVSRASALPLGKHPCTAFQGATVLASIQTCGILIPGKSPKSRVMFKRPRHYGMFHSVLCLFIFWAWEWSAVYWDEQHGGWGEADWRKGSRDIKTAGDIHRECTHTGETTFAVTTFTKINVHYPHQLGQYIRGVWWEWAILYGGYTYGGGWFYWAD